MTSNNNMLKDYGEVIKKCKESGDLKAELRIRICKKA
jgi:hypothetical protein